MRRVAPPGTPGWQHFEVQQPARLASRDPYFYWLNVGGKQCFASVRLQGDQYPACVFRRAVAEVTASGA